MQSRASLPATVGLIMIAAAVSISIDCSAHLPSQPTPPAATLRMLYSSSSCQQLRAGSSVSFAVLTYADGLYENVPASSVTWSSSNPAVLVASATGSFRMADVGSAEARAAYQGKSIAVVVTVPATSVLPYLELQASSNLRSSTSQSATVQMRTGFGTPLTNVTSSATFTSSDPQIATVEGPRITLTGGIGNAEIRVTANGLSGACALSLFPRTF